VNLVPGFISVVGDDNFVRFLSNDNLRTPLLRVVVWNFAFAFFSVALSFIVGLGVSMLFDDLPGRRIIRALLIVPYPIPVLVSVLIWRSMLNPDLGTIGKFLASVFGSSPQFFLDPMWTRIALIVVNIWLSYPYFYVVTSGALRAIPEEQYDAAEVDGAGPWQKFRYITFPQLIVIVMPLLIASFSFNFNNFNLVYIFNNGNPPMADTIIPVGQTDILISFIYKLAFVTSGASDYGLGAAISVALFVVVGSITWFQIRATRAFEAR
jgi:arabinogalactan oligomer/maltooligosaccharide transport system permease protein